MAQFETPRLTERLVPVHPVRIEAETAFASPISGEARDLSDGGACLALDADLEVGDELIMRLLFDQHDNPVPATGKVVWAASGGRSRGRYGIQWTHSGPQRRWIGWLVRT
jgi:Tfp pilus assembly protein PilZ